MKDLINKSQLKESIAFNGSISELKEQIRFKGERKFKLEWIADKEFKVLSKISFGTIIIDSSPEYFDAIKGYGKLTELNNGKTIIDLNTKLRIEIYFVIIIFVLAIIASLFSSKEIPIWSVLLFPIIVLCFSFIYRFQEKLLFEKVRNYIKTELKSVLQQRV